MLFIYLFSFSFDPEPWKSAFDAEKTKLQTWIRK